MWIDSKRDRNIWRRKKKQTTPTLIIIIFYESSLYNESEKKKRNFNLTMMTTEKKMEINVWTKNKKKITLILWYIYWSHTLKFLSREREVVWHLNRRMQNIYHSVLICWTWSAKMCFNTKFIRTRNYNGNAKQFAMNANVFQWEWIWK